MHLNRPSLQAESESARTGWVEAIRAAVEYSIYSLHDASTHNRLSLTQTNLYQHCPSPQAESESARTGWVEAIRAAVEYSIYSLHDASTHPRPSLTQTSTSLTHARFFTGRVGVNPRPSEPPSNIQSTETRPCLTHPALLFPKQTLPYHCCPIFLGRVGVCAYWLGRGYPSRSRVLNLLKHALI